MMLTAGPVGVLQLAEVPEPVAVLTALALPAPALDVGALPGALVVLLELLHAATDSTAAAIAAKSDDCRLIVIDPPGGFRRDIARRQFRRLTTLRR
jgi:hypothetical protein